MLNTNNTNIQITNPFTEKYIYKSDIVLFAHSLIGTVRGKSANGLMIHSPLFNVVAIIDKNACGKKTSELCKGVKIDVPIYQDIKEVLNKHKVRALVLLIPLSEQWIPDIEVAIQSGLDIINTSFSFLRNKLWIAEMAEECKVDIFDLRDVSQLKAYPNTDILKRKSKVIYVTGTDCGLGKRTAAFELTKASKAIGINAVMYATGQTGLMLGERGTVVDSLVLEFSNGIVSQHICQLNEQGYDIIFVEGQSDIFHPANSAMALAILHGTNPDGIIIVHDESRPIHKGFEENSDLYKMHPLKHYIDTFEMLSLPCGPRYKTIGIATIGKENIDKIKKMPDIGNLPIVDVLCSDGSTDLVDAILNYTGLNEKIKSYSGL